MASLNIGFQNLEIAAWNAEWNSGPGTVFSRSETRYLRSPRSKTICLCEIVAWFFDVFNFRRRKCNNFGKKNENLPFMWSQNKKHFFWIRNQIRNFLGFFKSHKKRKNKKLGCGKDPGFENPENHGFSKFLKKRKPCIVTARLRAVLYCSKRCS